MFPIGDRRSTGDDPAQWEKLRELVEAETGMDLSGSRQLRLRDAVEKVLSTKDLPQPLEHIFADPDHHGVFLEHLTAQLTVGETFFFRNEYHFQALAERVIPQILRENDARKEIRIWAAGCSTGEEPYSLAILLDQILTSRGIIPQSIGNSIDRKSQIDNPQSHWHVSILGTDLNSEFLEQARRGRYRDWSFRGTDVHLDRRYFASKGKEYRLVPRIREHVRFAYLNLVKDAYPSPLNGTLGLDLIVFRNVAIYLKAEIVESIIDRFHAALRPGGWLLLGETELNVAATGQFEVQRLDRAIFYRKKCGLAAFEEQPPAIVPEPVLPRPWQPPTVTVPRMRGAAERSSLAAPASVDAGPSKTSSLRERIDRHLSQQEFAEAERAIDAVTARRERAAARLRYALHLVGCAEIQRAKDTLEKCLSEEPLQIETHLLKASLAEEAGDFAKAERAYRRALYVDRRCAIAHFHLALVQQERNDLGGSRRSLQTVLDLTQNCDPNDVAEHSDGVCYGRLREMVDVILES